MSKKGYHITNITKGEYGKVSKIIEEYQEYCDALLQRSTILAIIELSDMYGALVGYMKNTTEEERAEHKIFLQGCANFITREAEILGYTIVDLMTFSKITERAFKNGHRNAS